MIAALNVDKLRLDMGDYVLSVQSLHKRLGRRTVLERIDLDVRRNTLTALVGPAGAGKTVTLACIAGSLKPSRGRVRYFGYELRGRPEERVVRMGIARAYQQPQIFAGMSVRETATVAALLRRPRVARAQAYADEMLILTGLAQHSNVPVAGLAEPVRRRLEIARALCTEPQLLLLDDVWIGLDADGVAGMCAAVSAVRARGTTVIAALRDAAPLASLIDNVVDIDAGRTVEIAVPAALELRA